MMWTGAAGIKKFQQNIYCEKSVDIQRHIVYTVAQAGGLHCS